MPDREEPVPERVEPLLEDSAEDLYEHAPCGYLSTLPDGTIVKVNQTFLGWTGFARDELVGARRLQDLLTAGGRIYHETHYAPLLRMQGAVREIALEIVRADGHRLPVLLNSALRTDSGGAPLLIRTTVFDATDRQRYERELLLARRREQAALLRTERLQRVTAALAGAPSPEAVAETVVAEVSGAVEAGSAVFAQPGPDGEVEILHRRGDDPRLVATARDVLTVGEPSFDPGTLSGHGALAVLPLLIGDRRVGVLALGFGEERPFDDDDRAFLTACAGQCAQALERTRLHEETAQRAQRAAFLADLGRALDELPGFSDRAERLVEWVVPVLAGLAWVEAIDDGERRPIVTAARDAEDGQSPTARRAPWARHMAEHADRALALRRPQVTADGRAVALPLRALGRDLGVLVLVRDVPEPVFAPRDITFATDVAERAAAAFENARLYEQEREVAHTLQRSLLAGALPSDPRFAIATTYRPAVDGLEVGGDWYDAFRIDQDRVGIVVGDVVGRGIAAASTMGQLRSAIRALSTASLRPGQLVERLDGFAETVPGAQMATLAYAEIDLVAGTMRYTCAGHPPPVLLQPGGGAPEMLWGGRSAPLGAYGGLMQRVEGEVTLEPGARLLLFTDGLVERRDQRLDHSLDRLVVAFGERGATPLDLLVDDLADELLIDAEAADDVCLLCLAFGAGTTFDREIEGQLELLAPLRADLRSWLDANHVAAGDRDAVVLAVNEAVANAIEHGFRDRHDGSVRVRADLDGGSLAVTISDDGAWRPPREPNDRGRGLLIMRRAMHDVDVEHHGDGTTVRMRRDVDGAAV